MKFLELKVPPVLVFLSFAGFIWIISNYIPDFNYYFPGQKWLGFGVFTIAVIIGLISLAQFRKAKTTVHPQKPGNASEIVTSGVYQISRNPMYLGLLLGLIGWCIYLGNLLNIFCLIGFIIYMNRFQIIPEETAMIKNFGAEFVEYKKSVRRWI